MLLLRAAVSIAALLQSAAYLTDDRVLTLAAGVAAVIGLACGVLLLIGFLTPIVSSVLSAGLIAMALNVFPASTAHLFDSKSSVIFALTITLSIACLGPGAFSIDARIFGRREIIIPHNPRSTEL